MSSPYERSRARLMGEVESILAQKHMGVPSYKRLVRVLAEDDIFAEDLMKEIKNIKRSQAQTIRDSNVLLSVAAMEVSGKASDTNIVARIKDHFESDKNASDPFNKPKES